MADWLPGSRYRRLLTSQATGLGVLTNEPLVVFAPDLTGKVLADFNDARFTDTDGTTLLKWGWEAKVAAAGVGQVGIPTLTSGAAAGYLYYGSTGADPGDASNWAGAFPASWKAHWPLNEASGSLADVTGNGHTLTAYGSPTYGQTGIVGNCLSFDGVNDYLKAVGWRTVPALPYAVMGWVKPTTTGLNALWDAAAQNAGTFRAIRTNGFQWHGHVGMTGPAYPTTSWTHLCVMIWHDGVPHIQAYVNGAYFGSAVGTSADSATAWYDPELGRQSAYGEWYSGLVDSFSIITGVLPTADQVAAHYRAGANTLFTWGAEEAMPAQRTRLFTQRTRGQFVAPGVYRC